MGAPPVADLAKYRKTQKEKAYRDLVMKTFCDMEHADMRETLQQKSAVERANRQKL